MSLGIVKHENSNSSNDNDGIELTIVFENATSTISEFFFNVISFFLLSNYFSNSHYNLFLPMTFESFCKGRKDPMSTPDPGKYNIPSTFGAGPKYTFRQKHKEYQKDYTAEYYLLPTTLCRHSITIGSRLKSRSNDSSTPGPSYMYSSMGSGHKSSIHIKHHVYSTETPGPGTYEPSPLSHGPAFTCGTGNRSGSHDPSLALVAPGSYDVPQGFNSRPMTIQSQHSHRSNKKPPIGPKYDVSIPLGKDSPKFGFPKGSRDVKIPVLPGPADYHVSDSFSKDKHSILPSFHVRHKTYEPEINYAPYHSGPDKYIPRKKSIGNRPPVSYETDSPGPIYDQGTTIVSKQVTIRPKTVIKDISQDTPSPCAYWLSPTTPVPPPIYGFCGPDNRSLINEQEQKFMPGPADYEENRTMEQDKHGVTIHSKCATKIRPDTSAPYNTAPSSLGGPMYTIGSRDA